MVTYLHDTKVEEGNNKGNNKDNKQKGITWKIDIDGINAKNVPKLLVNKDIRIITEINCHAYCNTGRD